ncbi:MAG: aminotransferase class I/II-fold pyridoxal phosphate-dependent enzyme, partial [Alphaproteobacteria bacterium]
MTMWLPKIDGRSGPKYQAIADSILDAIRAGDLGPGDRLPPQRELAWKLGVTVGTVTRAYLVGEQQGVLSGEVGRGTYVRRKPTPISNELLPRNLDNTLRLTVNASYSSDFETFLAEALRAIAEKKGLERLLHYMPAAGHPEHRALGAAWIARAGYQVPADQVFLTNGAQQALSVAMQVLTRPGEAILTEALTYTAVLDNARNLDRRLHGVAMDEDGVIPEALEAAAKTTGAKVV